MESTFLEEQSGRGGREPPSARVSSVISVKEDQQYTDLGLGLREQGLLNTRRKRKITLFLFFSFFFLGPHPRINEVARLGISSEL